jgi:tripartite-type tricarboxylate transporter receptor subunit TctC
MAPAGTPAAIVNTVSEHVSAILRDPQIVAKFADLGAIATPSTPAEFKTFLYDEIDKMTQVVQSAGIQPN